MHPAQLLAALVAAPKSNEGCRLSCPFKRGMTPQETPDNTTWSLFLRHQAMVVALFVFVGTWALQSLFDEHLQGADEGFPAGFLHMLARLDHFMAFFGAGLLCAGQRSRVRWVVPLVCFALAALAVASARCSLPCASHSLLPLLFVAAAGFVLGRRVILLNLSLLPAGWFFFCHLRAHEELAPGATHDWHFAAGLAVAAALSAALGMELGSLIRRRAPVQARALVAAILVVVALALAF